MSHPPRHLHRHAYALPGPGEPAHAYAMPTSEAASHGLSLPRDRRCPLCRQPVALAQRPDSRCPHCNSPLAVLPGLGLPGQELAGRRGAVRRDQSHVALVHVGWPSTAVPVRWRDLSLSGLSFYSPQPIPKGQTLHLIDSALEVVAQVVGCRPQGHVQAVHARMLTGLLLQSTGVFVSAQA